MISKQTKKEDILKLSKDCKCEKCENGCHYGSGAFLDEQLKDVAGFLKISEDELKEKYLEEVEKFNTKRFRPKILRQNNKPYGKCIFFDEEKKCTIHKVKPFECRIASGCSKEGEKISIWFMLNHFLNEKDPESVRQYSTYLKSGGKTIKGGEISEIIKDKNMLKKILSYEKLKQGA